MKHIVHLSDLHFRLNWEEDQELVLGEFFKDLDVQLQPFNSSEIYFVFSGDIVLAGANKDLFEQFIKRFDAELNKIAIDKSKRICVPGNT